MVAERTCFKCGMTFVGVGRLCGGCKTPRLGVVKEKFVFGEPLSFREKQIVVLIVGGRLNKEIAWELKLTVGTIKEYLNHVFRKTGMKNRTELASWAKCEFACPRRSREKPDER